MTAATVQTAPAWWTQQRSPLIPGSAIAFPQGGIDTMTLLTYAPLTPLGRQLAFGDDGWHASGFPSDPNDPDCSLMEPRGTVFITKDGRTPRRVAYNDLSWTVRRLRSRRYANTVGVADFRWPGAPRQIFTLRTSHQRRRGLASLTINRVAWRFSSLDHVWALVRTLFRFAPWRPPQCWVFQLDMYAEAGGPFHRYLPWVTYHGNAAVCLYDTSKRLLWYSHRLRRGDHVAAHADLPTGVMFGRPSGQRAARVYDVLFKRSTAGDPDSRLYMEYLNRHADADGVLPEATRFECIVRGRRLASLLGTATPSAVFGDLTRLAEVADYFGPLRLLGFSDRGPRYRPAVDALRTRQAVVGIHRVLDEYRFGQRPHACPHGRGRYPKRHLSAPVGAPDLNSILRDALRTFCGTHAPSIGLSGVPNGQTLT